MSKAVARRLAPIIIRCYPRAWRARYAAEACHLMELRAPTWGDLADLVVHVLYTWLHPDLLEDGEGDSADETAGPAPALRSSEIAIFWAVVTTMLAWVQFGSRVNGDRGLTLVGLVGAWPFGGLRPAAGVALAIQSAAVELACVATFMGGAPLLVVAWRRSPSVRRYFIVPLIALIGAVAPVFIVGLIPSAVVVNPTRATSITTLYVAWCVALVVASTWALTRIVREGQLDDGLLRYAFVPAVVATVALLLVTTMAWALAAHAEIPRLVDRAALARDTAVAAPWLLDLLDVLVMTVATGMAILATVSGARRRMTPLRRAE